MMSNQIVLSARMTPEEAQACESQIVLHLSNAQTFILDFYNREGWAALGFNSWRDWATQRFAQSQSNVYRLLNAAQIEHLLTGTAEGVIPPAQLRPLNRFKNDPEKVRTAWDLAEQLAQDEGKPREAKHVAAAVAVMEQATDAVRNGAIESFKISSSRALFQSTRDGGTTEWYTPDPIVRTAETVMGMIDLDPASCDHANQYVQAVRYYTVADDGLNQPWHGAVWFNFPYERTLDLWVQKLTHEVHEGNVSQFCGICYAVPDRAWYQHLEALATAVCFFRRRVAFLDASGTEQDSPIAANAVFYYGPHVSLFQREFTQFGRVMVLKTDAYLPLPTGWNLREVIEILQSAVAQTNNGQLRYLTQQIAARSPFATLDGDPQQSLPPLVDGSIAHVRSYVEATVRDAYQRCGITLPATVWYQSVHHAGGHAPSDSVVRLVYQPASLISLIFVGQTMLRFGSYAVPEMADHHAAAMLIRRRLGSTTTLLDDALVYDELPIASIRF